MKVGRYSIISYIIPHFRSEQTKNRKPEPAVSLRRKIESPFFI
nr:MAG TPA: hypothetical protein [Caudoviricetes sp.]